MADPVSINPTLTLAGQKAAISADNTGIEVKINYVSYGEAHYDPTGDEVALKSPVGSKIPLAGGSRPTPYQLRTASAWSENVGEVAIGEVGFWSDDILMFVWSKADGTVLSYKTDGVTYVLFNDLAFAQVPSGSISITVDPDESVALAALAAHEGASNAHPQYLLRADVAKDSGPLAWLGLAGGTANALVLNLVASEAQVAALAAGQRYQFLAATANTGAATANIEGLGVIAIKKGGDGGLVDLEANDIRAGAVYDLNYDGSHFQLGGGVGANKAYTRFSYTAYAGQSQFTAAHTPGSVIVLRNGREVTGYASAADGSYITMTTACAIGEAIEILAFKPFQVADTFTKAEIVAMFAQAGAAPVGIYGDFPVGVVPPGWLECDGAQYLIAAYPDLYAFIGTLYNLGNETAGYFRVPDTRGEFVRFWDHGRGVDAGRTIGSKQLDQFQGHWHGLIWGQGTAKTSGYIGNNLVNYDPSTSSQALNQVTDPLTDGTHGTPRTGSETRPRNIAAMRCIKAFGNVVNQGMIDVAALAAQQQVLLASGPVVGSVRNGKMTVTANSAQALYTADEIVLSTALGGRNYKINTVSKQIDISTVGANGIDVLANNKATFIALYAIYNPTLNVAALLATDATGATEVYSGTAMPAGYTASCLLTVVPADGTGKFKPFTAVGRTVYFQLATAYSSTVPSYTGAAVAGETFSVKTLVPPQAKSVGGEGTIVNTAAVSGTVGFTVAPGSSAYFGQQNLTATLNNSAVTSNFANLPLVTPQSLWISTYAGASLSPQFIFYIGSYTL